MNQYYWSASTNAFYAVALREEYEASGSLPSDITDIDDSVASVFMGMPPAGKYRATGSDGNPAWIDIPSLPNSELLKAALTSLSTEYQDDIEVLNRAWLAAAVNDGVNETTKKDAVVVQINARKAQYASDRAAVIAQYPV